MSSIKQTINSIYIHLPFCHKKCHYCTFPIQAVGNKNTDHFNHFNDQIQSKYIEYLLKEINCTLKYYFKQNQLDKNQKLLTLYFGGGTPSLISTQNLEKIIKYIQQYYPNFDPNYEMSIEADPDTFTQQTLLDYSNLGINRLSMGIQSFYEEDLKYMNRSHNLQSIFDSIEIIQQNDNFKTLNNVSFDLIMNTPNQTFEKWEYNLKNLLKFKPGHASLYSLAIEENSYYYKKLNLREGQFPLPSDHESFDIYQYTSQFMQENGYNHYEVSSYSKNENTESKHNKLYWEGNKQFFAFGMGASSLLNNLRFKRPTNLTQYYKYVNILQENPQQIFYELGEIEEGIDKLQCILMGGLRTKQGVKKQKIIDLFGNELYENIDKEVKKLQKLSNNSLFIEDEEYIKLNIIKGSYLADEITLNLLEFL